MTEISKIVNGHKKFLFASLVVLSDFLIIDYFELKNRNVAYKLIEKVHKYESTYDVFIVAESQSKYLKNKNIKQGKI